MKKEDFRNREGRFKRAGKQGGGAGRDGKEGRDRGGRPFGNKKPSLGRRRLEKKPLYAEG